MKVGGEPLQQEFNRGYDFILNTYGSAENIIPGKHEQMLLHRGIVIDIDFNRSKNYKLAAVEPPFSIYAKIIGEDIDVADPELEVEKIYYAPLFSMHYISIPEIGEEILILRESTNVSSKGYYIGRISDTSFLNFSPAKQYMDSVEQNNSSPEYKYGFSFDVKELRKKRRIDSPSIKFNCFSIPITFGDVVQQGRSQSYVRHSFNRNNKKGVLEQGLQIQEQNPTFSQNNDSLLNKVLPNLDPSIGRTATKNIHFVDSSIKKLGDYNLASTTGFEIQSDSNGTEKSMIANMADEIYNISTKENIPTLYRQVLGEKLIAHQKESNDLIRNMLEGLSGLTQTVQVLLDAFIDHEHALPKIELNLEKSITAKDRYVSASTTEKVDPHKVVVPGETVRIQTGTKKIPALGGGQGFVRAPVYKHYQIPAKTIMVPQPDKVIPGRTRFRKTTQKINFEAIIGGAENPRFTAPIQTDTDSPDSMPLPGAPQRNIFKTELGMKTAQINTDTENLIESISDQKEQLNNIFNKATDFLSKNQFIN